MTPVLICVLFILLSTVSGEHSINEFELLRYLSEYEYLKLPIPQGSKMDNEVKTALLKLQTMGGIKQTGQLDNATINLMSVSRCGDKDSPDATSFPLKGSKWLPHHFLYRVNSVPQCMSAARVKDQVRGAMALWSYHSNVNFTESSQGPVHIEVRFVKGGSATGVSHSSFSAHLGEILIDSSKPWTAGDKKGLNLFEVMVHAVGHVLGLRHTTDVYAAMSPFRGPGGPLFHLKDTDITELQEIYGRPNRPTPASRSICRNPKVDTIFKSVHGDLIIFTGDEYYVVTDAVNMMEYPKKISESWVGLPANIDAAFTSQRGRTYFFKGSQYWKYSGYRMDGNYPQPISEGFPGIPDDLDAAFGWESSSDMYFFKGNQFWNYNGAHRPPVNESSYPRLIGNWVGVPNNVDAVVSYRENTFFFKGSKYYIYDDKEYKVAIGYPRPVGPTWFGCRKL